MRCRTLIVGAAVGYLGLLPLHLAGCGSSGDQGVADGGPHGDAGPKTDGESSTHPKHDASPDARRDATRPMEAGSGEKGKDGGPKDAAEDRSSSEAGTTAAFAIDMKEGPARQFQPPGKPTAVSPYVYGINASGQAGTANHVTQAATRWGL